MIDFLPTYFLYLAGIVASAVISIYAIRKIIFITKNRKIYDVPDDTRKIHGAEIPSLGGIGIFIGYTVVAAFFWPRLQFYMPYILASTVILFFTGIYDDLMNMRPYKKLVAQLVASFITVYFSGIRLESLYGIAGIETIPYWVSIGVTTLCCTFFINVFNFIDGIDGLACMLGILYLALPASVFMVTEHYAAAGICCALIGATTGLLFYNFSPAKIYMGDTGSMFLGFNIFMFSLLFVQFTAEAYADSSLNVLSPQKALLGVIAMLYLPVFDAIRVFIIRGAKGISPLKADRAHLHYYLLDAGCTHAQAAFILVGINVVIIALACALQGLNPLLVLLCIMVFTFVLLFIIYRMRQKRLAKYTG
jgi:UDP-GlcNAc:undecaprenyl-phosphate/decaprenyl-phosphate GlcNAc-1-phosphate transferase